MGGKEKEEKSRSCCIMSLLFEASGDLEKLNNLAKIRIIIARHGDLCL